MPVYSQNSSSIGSVISPSMPVISSPTMGNGIYSPGFTYNALKNQNEYAKSRNADSSSENSVDSEEINSKSSIATMLNTLTANDISILGTKGLIGDFGTNSANVNTGTKDLLTKVLKNIEEIRTSIEKPSVEQNVPKTVSYKADGGDTRGRTKSIAGKNPSRILRFCVNKYDVLRTCSTVYISDVQADGTFLVTGDRRYVSDGKDRKETFHILFKTSPNEHGVSNYSAAAAISQDSTNENSFLYQLAKRSELKAMRTGNLVSMRTDEPDWKMDLLIDLGKKDE